MEEGSVRCVAGTSGHPVKRDWRRKKVNDVDSDDDNGDDISRETSCANSLGEQKKKKEIRKISVVFRRRSPPRDSFSRSKDAD